VIPPEISITHSARIPRAIFTHSAARSVRHIVQQDRFSAGPERFAQFLLIANLDLHRQRSGPDDLWV